jgi:hypothetical protein
MSDGQDYTVEDARAAAERDALGEWVAEFLSSPGSDNEELAAGLSERLQWWTGPIRLPLDQLHRLAGPPEDPVLYRVDDMERRIREEGWEPSPVIVSHRGHQLVLEDGNHRVESVRRTGRRDVWAIVGFESRDLYEDFTAQVPT